MKLLILEDLDEFHWRLGMGRADVLLWRAETQRGRRLDLREVHVHYTCSDPDRSDWRS